MLNQVERGDGDGKLAEDVALLPGDLSSTDEGGGGGRNNFLSDDDEEDHDDELICRPVFPAAARNRNQHNNFYSTTSAGGGSTSSMFPSSSPGAGGVVGAGTARNAISGLAKKKNWTSRLNLETSKGLLLHPTFRQQVSNEIQDQVIDLVGAPSFRKVQATRDFENKSVSHTEYCEFRTRAQCQAAREARGEGSAGGIPMLSKPNTRGRPI